jgi:signal transduction histidine kinase
MTTHTTRADYKAVLRLAVHPPIRETRFWIIQAVVFIIAGLHLFLDLHVASETGAFPSGVPVALLILPVGYAALRYSLAGAAATAMLAILLWLPDLLLPRDLGHVGGDVVELALIVIVAIVFGRRIDAERFAYLRSEEAMAKALDIETRFHRLFETIRSPMLVLDHDGVVSDANPAATQLLGRDLIGQMVTSLHGGDIALDQPVGQVVSLADGRDYRLDVVSFPDDSGNIGTQVIFEDVTEERSEGRRARRYAQLVIKAEEDQNRRLARELHDEPLQLFLLLARRLESLGDVLGVPAVVVEGLAEAHHQSLDAAGRLRNLARDLRPPTLDQLGLVAAISSLVADIEVQGGPDAEFEVTGVATRLNPEAELGAFRIVQEAIRNVLRHAQANRVKVAVQFKPDELSIRVVDDGQGFSPENQSEQDSEHLGLIGMRERARLLGGDLEVNSESGRGTVIVCIIPIHEQGLAAHASDS